MMPFCLRSFGVVLWEIITKQPPVRGHLREVRDDEAPPEIQKLLEDCINIEVRLSKHWSSATVSRKVPPDIQELSQDCDVIYPFLL